MKTELKCIGMGCLIVLCGLGINAFAASIPHAEVKAVEDDTVRIEMRTARGEVSMRCKIEDEEQVKYK